MLIRHLVTPEVHLEVVRNAVTTFSTTPEVRLEGSQNAESGKCDPQGPSGGG